MLLLCPSLKLNKYTKYLLPSKFFSLEQQSFEGFHSEGILCVHCHARSVYGTEAKGNWLLASEVASVLSLGDQVNSKLK